jgi:hypothetical protein
MGISLLLEVAVSSDPDHRGTGVHDMRLTVGELNAWLMAVQRARRGGSSCSTKLVHVDGSDPRCHR